MRSMLTKLGLLATIMFSFVDGIATGQQTKGQTAPFYIGTYTGGESQGIYRSELDLLTGQLRKPELVAELKNPSFIAIHRNQTELFAVSEVSAAEAGQQVFAYRILPSGQLNLINSQPAGGDGPCYITTDATGRYAFVANYGSGSVTSYAIKADGSLSEPVSNVQHIGSSIDLRRQMSPHAHCILTDPSNQYVCVADLGLDQVLVYNLGDEGQLTLNSTNIQLMKGSGPRHLAFHPDGKHAVVIHELTSQLSSLSWDSETGKFERLAVVSTLPKDYTDSNSTAEVLIHPNGKFVFGSNRGHNSIASYAFDSTNGALQLVGHQSTGGKTPRNFRLDPSGQFLLAENQNSDDIHVFRVDDKTGELAETGKSIKVGSPCCIRFLHQ